MSNMKREWESINDNDAERAWREAGLTRDTFDKLMAYAEKLREEAKECSCTNCTCGKKSDDSQ